MKFRRPTQSAKRHLQDVFSRQARHLADVLNANLKDIFVRHLEETFARYIVDVLLIYLEDALKLAEDVS